MRAVGGQELPVNLVVFKPEVRILFELYNQFVNKNTETYFAGNVVSDMKISN
jgi:hypothetical protein